MKILPFVTILLPLEAIYMMQATSIQTIYKKTEQGQNITGKRGAELTVVSQLECSIKCRGAKKCVAYQYQGTGPGNCLLIQPNCSDIEGPIFEQDKGDLIFKEVSLGRTKPNYWTGPEAALYYSFDGSDGLILMQGSQEVCHNPLVSGKVNFAWNLNHTRNQWIDLGIHTEVCMARPGTRTAGGAISLWLHAVECPLVTGIVSSTPRKTTAGVRIVCDVDAIRFYFYLPDGVFYAFFTTPNGWFHIVLNYIGPNNGQGIQVFYNGEHVVNDTRKFDSDYSNGNGHIVVGRYRTDRDNLYSSVQVDELIFFNKALTTTSIKLLYNAV